MTELEGSFFDRLEGELRAAAERPRRRLPGMGRAALALVLAALAGLALVPVLVLLGGGDEDGRPGELVPATAPLPVGTVISKGKGSPPRDKQATVVATGVAPISGPWQLEQSRSQRLADADSGEEYQPAGLRCLDLRLVDPPMRRGGLSGFCGEFPRTPGFGRQQATVPPVPGSAREILVYGRVPERAVAVVLTAPGGYRREMAPLEGPPTVKGDFYVFAIPPDSTNGRVNWIAPDGSEGSRGIALLPP